MNGKSLCRRKEEGRPGETSKDPSVERHEDVVVSRNGAR